MEISKSQISDEVEKFEKKNKSLHSILDPWRDLVDKSKLSDSDKSKTKDELFTLAKFIGEFSEPLEIIEGIRECPDFIVSIGEKRVGIELSQIVLDSKDKQRRGTVKKIFNRVEESLSISNHDSKYNGIYHIRFNSIDITGKNSSQVEEELRRSFEDKHVAGTKFIESIKMTCPFESIVLTHGGGWVVGQVDQEILDRAILKKESKLENYEIAATLEQWLLLFTSGIGTSGGFSFIGDETFAKEYDTNFSRIFLFESFGGEIHELSIKPQNRG